jgi:hypothetical protein
MFIAAFLSVVPNKLGGILTTSTRVDIENKCIFFLEFQFMNLWVIWLEFLKILMIFEKNYNFFPCPTYFKYRILTFLSNGCHRSSS